MSGRGLGRRELHGLVGAASVGCSPQRPRRPWRRDGYRRRQRPAPTAVRDQWPDQCVYLRAVACPTLGLGSAFLWTDALPTGLAPPGVGWRTAAPSSTST